MDKIIFTEEFCQPENLSPFTLTRQIQDIRVGILTIREKWERMLDLPSFDRKEDDYKDLDRSVNVDEALGKGACYMIHGNVLPSVKLLKAMQKLKNGEFISANGNAGIIFRLSKKEISEKYRIRVTKSYTIKQDVKVIHYPWDIVKLNDWAIREDFELLTRKRKSQPLSRTNKLINPKNWLVTPVKVEVK